MASRIGCLLVPDFPLAALCRAEPELSGRPLAVVAGEGPRAKVVAVSAAASRLGVRLGMSAAQARTVAGAGEPAVAGNRAGARNLAGAGDLAAAGGFLLVRPRSGDAERAAAAALVDVAASVAERVEEGGEGTVYLDVSGSAAMFSSEEALAAALSARAARVGLTAHVGIGSSKTVARLAAAHGGGALVVPPGTEAGFLAPLPVTLLEPDPAIAATLERWGIRRMGELGRLPAAEVAARVGPAGALLVARARGEEDIPLVPRPLPPVVEEAVELDHPLEALEPLLFVLRGLIDRLVSRLAVRSLACGALYLSLALAGRGHDERTVAPAAPTRDVRALLELVRLEIERRPPGAAIEGVHVRAMPAGLRPVQGDLFRPAGPTPERLAATLARLASLCGPERVGAPVAPDTHRPDAWALAPFDPSGAPQRAGARQGGGACRTGGGSRDYGVSQEVRGARSVGVQHDARTPQSGGGQQAGGALRPCGTASASEVTRAGEVARASEVARFDAVLGVTSAPRASSSPQAGSAPRAGGAPQATTAPRAGGALRRASTPRDGPRSSSPAASGPVDATAARGAEESGGNNGRGPAAAAICRLGLRALRPPRAAEVFCDRGYPDFVRGSGFGGRVVRLSGPWRVAGEWWTERPYARDYYDVALSDGGLYRLYCEVGGGGGWFVDGVYD